MASKLKWPIREKYYIATKYSPNQSAGYSVSKFVKDGITKYSAWSRDKKRPKKSEHNTVKIPRGSDYFES